MGNRRKARVTRDAISRGRYTVIMQHSIVAL